MKTKSSFKEIQKFKEIASILKIDFKEAEGFYRLIKKNSVDENYKKMNSEEQQNITKGA